jgi:hypothetical protein
MKAKKDAAETKFMLLKKAKTLLLHKHQNKVQKQKVINDLQVGSLKN